MQNGGGSFLSIGQGQGEDKAEQAIEQALNHPLLGRTPNMWERWKKKWPLTGKQESRRGTN